IATRRLRRVTEIAGEQRDRSDPTQTNARRPRKRTAPRWLARPIGCGRAGLATALHTGSDMPSPLGRLDVQLCEWIVVAGLEWTQGDDVRATIEAEEHDRHQ